MSDRTRKTEFPLDWPVALKGKEIRAIMVRRPTGADMYHLPENPEKGGIVGMFTYISTLISTPTGEALGEEFLREMDGADLNALMELLGTFSRRAGPAQARPAA
jgi:hypothetical protein